MNILFVSDVYLPTVSGVASSTDSIVRFMVSKGHTVTLVCPKPLVQFDPVKADGVTIVYTPPYRDALFINKSYTPFPLGFPVLLRILKRHTFDVMHIQEPGSLGISALILAKIRKIPTVGADHFSLPQIEKIVPPVLRWASVPFMKIYMRLIYRNFSAIMVPTETAAHELAGLIGHRERIYPVSNGVDTTEYVPISGSRKRIRKRYGLPEKIPIFLYIGRLDADKNIDTTINALSAMNIPWHLVVAGVGKQGERLHRLVHALMIDGSVTWMENINKQTIIDLYQLSDCFVITSPVETQSIVALQAISCGLPVIAANAGALPELVIDGKNGYLVDTYDVHTLTEKLHEIAMHPGTAKRMGEQSRMLSLSHHKPVVLERLERLYDTVRTRV